MHHSANRENTVPIYDYRACAEYKRTRKEIKRLSTASSTKSLTSPKSGYTKNATFTLANTILRPPVCRLVASVAYEGRGNTHTHTHTHTGTLAAHARRGLMIYGGAVPSTECWPSRKRYVDETCLQDCLPASKNAITLPYPLRSTI